MINIVKILSREINKGDYKCKLKKGQKKKKKKQKRASDSFIHEYLFQQLCLDTDSHAVVCLEFPNLTAAVKSILTSVILLIE